MGVLTFILAFEHWGHGYATEAARLAVGYGFGAVALQEVVGDTSATNRRSRAVMERLGMRRDPADDFDCPTLPKVTYSDRMYYTASIPMHILEVLTAAHGPRLLRRATRQSPKLPRDELSLSSTACTVKLTRLAGSSTWQSRPEGFELSV
jgi:hypothetical protein